MRMNLVLELLDVPGQLVSVLEPISGLGANLVTVIHKRDFKNDHGMVPVQLTLEGDQENLEGVVKRFEELGITIVEMDGVVKKEMVSTILYGHIVDKDIRDTMDKINALDGVYVIGFDIKLDGEKKSTALINLETDFGKKQYAFDKIAEIAQEKDLLMINEV
ncbi:MAG: amino acid-binding protein [Methanobrevibacter sp.]|nr:amino acid-binding protein [Methanobrevibacter sp.]